VYFFIRSTLNQCEKILHNILILRSTVSTSLVMITFKDVNLNYYATVIFSDAIDSVIKSFIQDLYYSAKFKFQFQSMNL